VGLVRSKLRTWVLVRVRVRFRVR